MTGAGHVRLEHGHTLEAISERLSAGPRHNYLRDCIYGGVDGAVTTFSVVAGVVGAELSPSVVLIMGFANLAADGFSMAASNFLGTRAEREDLERLEAVERRHIEVVPEGEREEVRQIFRNKGFGGDELEAAVGLITADQTRWVRTMLAEEYGLPAGVRSPLKAALATFAAFCACGLVPLLPYAFGAPEAFRLSSLLTGGVFFAIGSAKSRWSTASWWRSGLSTLAVGGLAAGLAYAIGLLLRGLAG